MLKFRLQTFDIVCILRLYQALVAFKGAVLIIIKEEPKQLHKSCDFVFVPCIGFKTPCNNKSMGLFAM